MGKTCDAFKGKLVQTALLAHNLQRLTKKFQASVESKSKSRLRLKTLFS